MPYLVGDVSSAARILPDLHGKKLKIVRAKGAYLWDEQGQRYIDTALGFGAVLLGHADEAVNAEIVKALEDGAAPSWAHVREEYAAATLAKYTGDLTKVVFNNSGSEAVHLACRIARAYTGKNKIAKMAAGFDGWLDDMVLGNVTTKAANFKENERPSTAISTLLKFNDFTDIERLFAQQKDIAAVIFEPMLANAGCIMPESGYLQQLQRIVHAHGALLISDEVLMGFRLHAGLAAHWLGLQPDLATVGKAIGNGIAVSAVVGKADIMQLVENNQVLRGGTFSGNPIACAAVASVLPKLAACDYQNLLERGEYLQQEIAKLFGGIGIDIATNGYGSVFSLWPCKKAPATYTQALQVVNPDFSLALHLALREQGLLVMPSAWGRLYLSMAHDESVIEQIKAAFARALSINQAYLRSLCRI